MRNLMDDKLSTCELPGYRGIWYGNQPTDPPAYWKYSGGLATYPQQHVPIAIYCPLVNRTYIAFGGAGNRVLRADYRPDGEEASGETVCGIGYYDHSAGRFTRPVSVVVRDVNDAHENPVLCLDPQGHLLVFCPGHGNWRQSDLFRSRRAHDLSAFDLVRSWPKNDNFSYPQPWWIQGVGCVLLHTRYDEKGCRRLAVTVSPDGLDWSDWSEQRYLSKIAEGGYQTSSPGPNGLIGTIFDMHPLNDGDIPLNRRTNLYYAQTRDGGLSWETAAGLPLDLPLVEIDNPALVLDARAAGELVYIKDVQFDQRGRPVLLYLTSHSAMPTVDSGLHDWWLARFDGKAWSHHRVTRSGHNYDHGSLLLVAEDDWRLLAPTDPGPQSPATGGTMVMHRSADGGRTWKRDRAVFEDPDRCHTYARRPLNAHADLSWVWAAADAHRPGPVTLFAADARGQVLELPWTM